jgi:hypothetical protein
MSMYRPVPAFITTVTILGACVFGCSESQTKPAPSRATLTGRIRLISNLFDLGGQATGQRSVDDADGVRVILETPSHGLDSTVTARGQYQFTNLGAGTYRVSSWVLPAHQIRIPDIAVLGADVSAPDTLVLGPLGAMHTAPNPSEPEGFGLEFTANGPQRYRVEILDLGLTPTWSFSDTTYGGFNHIHWDGDGPSGEAAPEGAYWAVVHVNGIDAYNLAFWSPGAIVPNPGNCGHILADGLFVRQSGAFLVTEWRGVQHGALEVVPGIPERDLQLQFLRSDSTAFALADTCPENYLSFDIADTSLISVALEAGRKWTFDLVGKRAGTTTVILNAWHQNHVHIHSLPIPVTVLD